MISDIMRWFEIIKYKRRYVAMVLDRLFLWIFTIAVIGELQSIMFLNINDWSDANIWTVLRIFGIFRKHGCRLFLLTILGLLTADPISQISSSRINVNFGRFNYLAKFPLNILKYLAAIFSQQINNKPSLWASPAVSKFIPCNSEVHKGIVRRGLNKVEIWSMPAAVDVNSK